MRSTSSPFAPSRVLSRPIILFLLALLPAVAFAQRDLKDIPDPDPEIERKSFIVAEGFEVNLFAADPQIAKPIQMNFDERGRLWIASSEVYPHIEPGQKADDKILVIEDENRDGKADKTTVFAGGLLIPTGVLPGDGGVYVANSTELLHLSDTDDDGRADRRRVVLSGFGTEDTHHLLHTLRWGHDGAIYMNQSIYIHSHVETPRGVKHLNGGGIWRFRPDTLELDVFCRGFVNAWGHHFDRWGQSFATDGAYREGINYVFPGAVFVTAVGAKRTVTGLNPGSPKHCGLEILSGRHLPDDWQGDCLTNDFRAHRVCRFKLSEDGSGYASRQETELIKTRHVAFRPIDVKVGPDGAIYIADWYNPIIQHGEVDFRDPRRDHVHGRIWRVTAKNRPLVEPPDFSKLSTAELLDQLKVEEESTRLWAKQELKRRGAEKVIPPLQKWLEALGDDVESDHHRLEALWLHQTLNQPNETLLCKLLESSDHRARAAAVRVTAQWKGRIPSETILIDEAIDDPHPRVRLEGVRAAAALPFPEAAAMAATALDKPMDRFLDFALWQTTRDLSPHWLPALRAGEFGFEDVSHLTFALKAVDSPDVVGPLLDLAAKEEVAANRAADVFAVVGELGGPQHFARAVKMLQDGDNFKDDAHKATALAALVNGGRRRNIKPAGELSGVAAWIDSENESLRAAALAAAGVWKVESMRKRIAEMAVTDPRELSQEVRYAALDALALLGGKESQATLAQIAASYLPFADRSRACAALASVNVKVAAARAVDLLAISKEGDEFDDLIAALVSRGNGAKELSAALSGKELPPDVAKRAVRAARKSPQPAEELVAALQAAGGLKEAAWKLTDAFVKKLTTQVAESADPARGEQVYRRKELQCLNCHGIGGAGGQVGPDMSSIGASAQIDYLIESLIEPNKKIKENFHTLQIATVDGEVLAGVPVRQTPEEIVLRTAEDKQITVPVASIEQKKDGRSLMPDGTVDSLTESELADLVRFLSELGKVGEFSVDKRRVVRRWRSLVWTQEANRRLNRTSFDLAAAGDPDLLWTPAYSLVGGGLPLAGLDKFKPHREVNQTSFVRAELNVTTPGQVSLQFNDITGLSLWLDAKPTPIKLDMPLELSAGLHTITLAIDRETRTEPISIELADIPGSKAQLEIIGGK